MIRFGRLTLTLSGALLLLALKQAPAMAQTDDAPVARPIDLNDPVVTAIRARAEAGDVEAMLDMALLVSNGRPTYHSDSGAWLERAAKTGDGEALFRLGEAAREGDDGIAADPMRAAALIKQAAEKGNGYAIDELDHPDATPRLADPLPYPVPQDGVERLRWAIAFGDQADTVDSIDANDREIRELSLAGYGAHITDWRVGFEIALIGARHGDMDGMYGVASDYLDGEGVAPDAAQAETWYKRLAETGGADDLRAIADLYAYGHFGPHREADAKIYYRRAADAYRVKAEAGDDAYQVLLAGLYGDGRIDGGDAQAFLWYQKAAKAGNSDAEVALAKLYIAGRGTAKDVAQGLTWWTRAADNNGKRLLQDDGDDGVSAIQQGLGELYYAGKDVPRDYAKAFYWLELADDTVAGDGGRDAVDNNQKLQDEIGACRKHLTPAQQAKIAADLKAWHAAHDWQPQ